MPNGGGTAGAGRAAQSTIDRVTLSVYAVFSLPVVGSPTLVLRRPARWPAWLPLASTWLGSGAMSWKR